MSSETQTQVTSQHPQPPQPPAPYQFNLKPAFSSRLPDGSSRNIPFLVDGLLPLGELVILGGKPKISKSSVSRHLSVSASKGGYFLGRPMTRCESLIISLEDPDIHVDNALQALSHDSANDAAIRIVYQAAPTPAAGLVALRYHLDKYPENKLVIIDTLAKFLRIGDLSDYGPVMLSVLQLSDIAREYNVSIVALAHCKKSTASDDLFDRILGSSALRGGVATNIILFKEGDKRFIASETRIGRCIPPTLLESELTEINGATYLQSLRLGASQDDMEALRQVEQETAKRVRLESSITAYISSCGDTATQGAVLQEVTGKNASLIEAINDMVARNVITVLPDVAPKTLRLTQQ